MSPMMARIFSMTVFMLAAVHSANSIGDTVDTTSGVVKGELTTFETRNVYEFRMVPYAEPPVGDLRFKPPKPKSRQQTTIDGTKIDYVVCPQLFFSFEFSNLILSLIRGNYSVDESCLFLDIYAPATATADNRLPVLFWIHGGGYTTGAGRFSSGRVLAALYDVIVVSINYRLGVLGFFNTGDESSEGDFGLQDQIMALQWVNDNIQNFGGDVTKITIAGESAGGDSVALLTVAPRAQGLFKRAIIQSGGLDHIWACSLFSKATSMAYARKMNCSVGGNEEVVKCLRGKSIEDLIKDQVLWSPNCIGDVVPYSYQQLRTTAKGSDVATRMAGFDVMVGVNAQEGGLYVKFQSSLLRPNESGHFDRLISSLLPLMSGGITEKEMESLTPIVKYLYTDWQRPGDKDAEKIKLIDFASDVLFVEGAVKYNRLHSAIQSDAKGSSYFYLLNPRPSWMSRESWRTGADHGDDLFFMFGDPVQFPQLNATDEEKLFSRTVMAYWTNFIKSGDPNSPSTAVEGQTLVQWPQFDPETESYLSLDFNMTSESVGQHVFARRVAFWTHYFPTELNRLRSLKPPEPCKETVSGCSRNMLNAFLVFSAFVFIVWLH